MQDPTALFRFQEHDVYLPMVVLEELDAAKSGTSEIARNVREVTRILDEVVRDAGDTEIERGIALPGPASRGEGPPVPANPDPSRPPPGCAPRLEAGQRNPERREGAPSRAPGPPRRRRFAGHQPAHQGPRARNPGRGLPRRRRPRRRLAPLPRRVPGAGWLLGRLPGRTYRSRRLPAGGRTDRPPGRRGRCRRMVPEPVPVPRRTGGRGRGGAPGRRTGGRCWSPCATTGPEPTPCGA